MGKCRICLNNRKRMHSLCDYIEEGITFAEIVTSIANVKVVKNDGLPYESCLACCNKLKDIYNFRCQIERSDIELQKTVLVKRIRFTDIKDIKSRIKIRDTKSIDAMHDTNITENFVKSCENSFNYNNTVIKKLAYTNSKDTKTLTMKEFIESIKEDPQNEYDIIYDMAVDYEPESDAGDDEAYDNNVDYSSESHEDSTSIENKLTNISNKKSNKLLLENSVSGNMQKTIIKPVYLSDIRVLRTKVISSNAKSKTNKRKQVGKADMCPHCGKMVKSLKVHLLIHSDEKNYKCEKCAKCYYTSSALKSHEMIHENKIYKCDKCVAIFRKPFLLKSHQSSLHSGDEKKFACETCGKSFKRRCHLSRHYQGVHNMGQKKFICEQCPMSFLSKSSLKHHMRVHTGERPYKCEICSQPYSYKTDFTRHCLKKHGVFLKGRQVNVLNGETLEQERVVMRDLVLRVNGTIKDDKPINPFEGPHAVKVFKLALKALEAKQINLKV